MTPEADRFLQTAQKHLERARIMLSVGLNEDTGRAAYLAGFHAAQAFIFEKIGKVLKTHKGVQTEFLRITKDDLCFKTELRIFLSHAYNFKAIADYETGLGSEVSTERVTVALETATRFVECITDLLATRQGG